METITTIMTIAETSAIMSTVCSAKSEDVVPQLSRNVTDVSLMVESSDLQLTLNVVILSGMLSAVMFPFSLCTFIIFVFTKTERSV